MHLDPAEIRSVAIYLEDMRNRLHDQMLVMLSEYGEFGNSIREDAQYEELESKFLGMMSEIQNYLQETDVFTEHLRAIATMAEELLDDAYTD